MKEINKSKDKEELERKENMEKKVIEKLKEEFEEMSGPGFKVIKNDVKSVLEFFKEDLEDFVSAVETGKLVYGKNGGYKKEDEFIVIDLEHPFGISLYSSSDPEIINNLKQELGEDKKLEEDIESESKIFDILGIEEDNRKDSKHLVGQYKELEQKFPDASIWLKGDVGVFVDGKVVGETADLSAVNESKIEEKIEESKPEPQKSRSAKSEKIHDAQCRHKQRVAELGEKFVSLKDMREAVEPELPSEVDIKLSSLISSDTDVESVFLDDSISDHLSDEFGFCHFGFNYEVIGDTVHVTDIAWDTSCDDEDDYEDDLQESKTLNENTSNFGSNKIINLCSPAQEYEDFKEYAEEEKEENTEISEEELDNMIYDLIAVQYEDMYAQVKAHFERVDSDIERFVELEPGYFEGFYIKFNFDDGADLAQSWFDNDKEYAVEQFTKTVKDIEKALKQSIEDHLLTQYAVAYRFSNGETGYNLSKSEEQDVKALEEAMKKVLEEGLEAIEEEYIDELE